MIAGSQERKSDAVEGDDATAKKPVKVKKAVVATDEEE
jgi:hypothetical protein